MDNARMRAGAAALADDVRNAEIKEQRRSWRKVTTILSVLGVSRLTPAVREAAGRALADAGLVCEPSMDTVPRSGTVRLSTIQAVPGEQSPQISASGQMTPPLVTAEFLAAAQLWPANTAPRALDLETIGYRPKDTVLVVEVNPSAEPSDAFSTLYRHCNEDLTQDMVDDLLEADEIPKVRIEPGWNARNVSTFGVSVQDEQADTSEPDVADLGSKAGTVFFEMVEFIVGSDWVLVCWHNAAKLPPDGKWTDSKSSLRDQVMRRVADQWPSSSGRSGSDLALLISTEMTRTHVLAQQEISQWLESWEAAIGDRTQVETATLSSLRRALREYRKRLQAQDQWRHSAPDNRWFAASLTGHETTMRAMIEQAASRLNAIAQSVRSGTELVTMTQMREQLAISHKAQMLANAAQDTAARQQDATTQFQNTLTVLGAILLGPGLVAAVYGANVDLPGRDRVLGTLILVAGMLAVSVLSFVLVRRMQRRRGGEHRHDQASGSRANSGAARS